MSALPGVLTDAEHAVMQLTADLWLALCDIVGDGRTREEDLREAALHIHAIQTMVLAQAAARAYPDRYRLLGRSISTAIPARNDSTTTSLKEPR